MEGTVICHFQCFWIFTHFFKLFCPWRFSLNWRREGFLERSSWRIWLPKRWQILYVSMVCQNWPLSAFGGDIFWAVINYVTGPAIPLWSKGWYTDIIGLSCCKVSRCILEYELSVLKELSDCWRQNSVNSLCRVWMF